MNNIHPYLYLFRQLLTSYRSYRLQRYKLLTSYRYVKIYILIHKYKNIIYS